MQYSRSSNRRLPIVFGQLVLAMLYAPALLVGQQAPLLDRAVFFEDPAVSDMQISPSGRLLAFRAPFDGQKQLWISLVHLGVDSAVRVSDGPVEAFFWSRDSRKLLFLRDGDGNENYQLYEVDADTTGGAVPRNLTPDDGSQARVYALPDSEPGVVVVGLNDRDPRAFDIYRIDMDTGERQLVLRNDAEVADWVTDLDGIPRFGVRYGPDGSTELLRIRGDTLDAIYGCAPDEVLIPLRFHRDNRRLYLVTDLGERERTELVLIHPVTLEVEEVDEDPEGLVDFGEAVFSPDSDRLVATVYHDDTTRVYAQDSVFSVDLDWLAEQLPFGSLTFGSASNNGALWVLRIESDTNPGSFYLYNRWYDTVEPIAESRPALPRTGLATSSWISYGTSDGENIRALLTLPHGDSAAGLPAVLLPHDGPWSRDRLVFDPMVQFLANRGYAVLQPNYRGSRGFGKEFLAAGNGAWGTGVMQQDLTDGARFLVDRGFADPNRLGIMGFGYGGYATLAGLALTPDLFAAGIAVGAMTDLSAYVNDIRQLERLALPRLHHRVGNPDLPEDRVRLDSQSPLRAARAIAAPVLLAHGVNNPRVPLSQTERMVAALRSTGNDVEYLRIAGEGHRFHRVENRVAFAAVLERFLAENLGGRVQTAISSGVAENIAELSVGVEASLGTTASALAAPLPPTNSSAFERTTLRYRMLRSDEDETQFTRRILDEVLEGRAIWRVIDSTLVPVFEALEFDPTAPIDEISDFEPQPTGEMVTAADTVDMDRSSLEPLRRRTGGMASAYLDFTADRVTGEFEVSAFVDDIDVPLEAPVFSDGAGLDLVIAGLPLADGYETGLRSFDLTLGQVVPQILRVTGMEQVDTPAGSFEAFQITLEPVGVRYAEAKTLLVRQQAPHILLRSTIQVQSEFGSYDQTTELISLVGGSR